MHGARLPLEHRKSPSTTRQLRILPPPARVIVPVHQPAGVDSLPLVSVGDIVNVGQAIASSASGSAGWLHAPINGRVIAIDPRELHERGSQELCIEIENDGRHAEPEPAALTDYRALAPQALIELIARGGIVGMGGAAFPTAAKLAEALGRDTIDLLLNGVECEPYISCDDILMRERAALIIDGAKILMHALTAGRCVIAIESDKPAALAAMHRALQNADDKRISIVTVPAIYPAGGERQAIQSLLAREVPHRGLPIDVNVVCQNVGTVAAVAQWILAGVPLIRRIVTVTGGAIREPQNVEVAIGTPFAEVIAACGGYSEAATQLVMGGSMMGFAVPNDAVPVLKATNCVLAVAARELRPRAGEMACIRCGDCAEVCPASLLPQQLHWFSRRGEREALEAFGLLDCIECGCCDYVCPSQIPLTQEFREAKRWLLPLVDAQERAAQARARFDKHTARLAFEEAELVRKRAALKSQTRERQG